MNTKLSIPDFRSSLHGLPYSETVAADPPRQGDNAIPPGRVISAQDTPSAHLLATINAKPQDDDTLQASSSFRDSQTSDNTNQQPPSSRTSAVSVIQGQLEEDKGRTEDKRLPLRTSSRNHPQETNTTVDFQGIALDLPSTGLTKEFDTENMKFSKRGSMFLNGVKANADVPKKPPSKKLETIADKPEVRTPSPTTPPRTATKLLSTDEELLSDRVRSYYLNGSDVPMESINDSAVTDDVGPRRQDTLRVEQDDPKARSPSFATSVTTMSQSGIVKRRYSIKREDHELAGGLEDWQDVDNEDVDRYGFIVPRSQTTNGLHRSTTKRDPTGIQRVSSSLQLASETPRRRKSMKRSMSLSKDNAIPKSASDNTMRRPVSSQSASVSRHSTFRSRDRKLMDEAGDMLTLPRSASSQIASSHEIVEDSRARRKEVEREEKWRKMARTVPSKSLGGGMVFEFDTQNPKLIERTWKGIPDKWRATAWHAFLSASARKRKGSLSDKELISAFDDYQSQSSPDDVQIDIDVPRTISSHIMFRRRYRGGQRLLFRVLHAMSLHFAELGYVQGMATLAATLLAYYEEEKAFVMLVRLWELRGLEALYRHGFGGLMAALDDFEKQWLGTGEVSKKLTDLGIPPTSYGTRWYLTLFNYSIPFAAQLRVWDVFMLLGDDLDLAIGHSPEQFGSTLDVLHAASAALIDGMRDILLESDFENAMKVLTSWVPIKDEDLFMRVAKAEWKMHKKKA